MDKEFIKVLVIAAIAFVGAYLIYYGIKIESKKVSILGLLICFINAVYWTAKFLKK